MSRTRLLLHICCAPCLTYPLATLRASAPSVEVCGYFFNHNIHPYQEFLARLAAVESYCRANQLELVAEKEYLLDKFLEKGVQAPAERCLGCYSYRLKMAARYAADHGYDSFTTTLLYSLYQNHEQIVAFSQELAAKYKLTFYYEDWRTGWQAGRKLTFESGIYRQQYCGCIFSEYEACRQRLARKKMKQAQCKIV